METCEWQRDILGPGFQQLALPLADGQRATLVRCDSALDAALAAERVPEDESGSQPAGENFLRDTAVLYLHGWSDYFFNRRLARLWTSFGARFYALDLRDYGRNLRPGDPDQMPGYIDDLAAYDEEIEAALAIISAENPTSRTVLAAHSTGGLIAALWANRNPGRLKALALNAPWLEFQFSAAARRITTPFLGSSKRKERAPRALPLAIPNFYVQAASENHGAPPWDLALKPPNGFPVYGQWLRAIFDGHEEVAAGLDIREPVLVQISQESFRGTSYTTKMAHSDIVLDVDRIARRAVSLGRVAVLARVAGAVHDVFLSDRGAFDVAAEQLRRFARGYIAG